MAMTETEKAFLMKYCNRVCVRLENELTSLREFQKRVNDGDTTYEDILKEEVTSMLAMWLPYGNF